MEISVYLSGTEFPLQGINVLNSLQIDMSIKVLIPTMHLVLTDEIEMISKSTLVQDGTPISVVIKAMGNSDSQIYNFRVFKFQSFRATIGTMYQIDAYLDYQKYWLQTSSTGIQGTSNYVLGEVAAACGLKYDGITTNDSQLWLPQNRTYSMFVKKTVEYAYASDSSLIMSGLTLDGTLMLRDMNSTPDPNTIVDVVLGQYVEGKRMVTDYVPKNNAGLNNLLTGYNHARVRQSAIAGAETYKDVVFFPNSKSPFFSEEAKNVAQRGFVMYSPIDFGNVHESYERAYYQNQRYRNLMSAGVDFLSVWPTNLNLFDTFNFIDREVEDHEINNSWSGNYRLTSKAIRIEGAAYSEYFEGYRHGTNVTG